MAERSKLTAVEKLQKGSVITSYFVTSGIQLYWLGKYANATSGINKVDNSRSNNLNEYVMKEMVEGKTIKTAEDIRYEQYWLDVEAGKYDIPYNMSQQEYTQYLNGLSKVDTQLAINKINFGEVLRLRSEINLNSNVFFQGISGAKWSAGSIPTVSVGSEGISGTNVENINPNDIRFSQSSVNGSEDIINSMKANGWQGDPIDVVKMPDGNYTTIDNTRVATAREAEIDVQATVRNYDDSLPADMIDRFTTKKGVPQTWGEALELRIGKQNSIFRNGNPLGSYEMPELK